MPKASNRFDYTTIADVLLTIDGIASACRGNAPAWSDLQGREPFGRWELALPDRPEIRAYFENEEVEEILFVITYQGRTPDWPA